MRSPEFQGNIPENKPVIPQKRSFFNKVSSFAQHFDQGIQDRLANVREKLKFVNSTGLTPIAESVPQVDSAQGLTQDKKPETPKKTMDDIKPGLLDGVFANTFSDRFLGRPKVTSPRNTPHAPTAREIIEANLGKMAPHGLEKAIQDAAKNRAARTVAAGAALAGTAYITVNQGPAIIRSIMSIKDNVAGWFSNFGGGEKTVPIIDTATKEQIREFLRQTPPALKTPEVGGNAPEIGTVVPGLDNSKITTIVGDTKASYNGGFYSSPDNHSGDSYSYIEAKYSDLTNLPVVQGAQKVEIKAVMYPYGISSLDLKYTLNNGDIIKGSLGLGGKFIPSDVLKNVVSYDPNKITASGQPLTGEEKNAIQGTEFDLIQDPVVSLVASGSIQATLILANSQSIISPTTK